MSLSMYLGIDVDTGGPTPVRMDLAEAGYTHNVIPMWKLVGVYEALYESHGKMAEEVIAPLTVGVAEMGRRIEECRALNPENGWGDADRALEWLTRWLRHCSEHPKATITVFR